MTVGGPSSSKDGNVIAQVAPERSFGAPGLTVLWWGERMFHLS